MVASQGRSSNLPYYVHDNTNAVPFPQLAAAIQNAPLNGCIEAFQELAIYAILVDLVDRNGPSVPPDLRQEWVRQHRWLRGRKPANSTISAQEFAYEFQRCIVAAATRPEVDPHGHVAWVIADLRLDPATYGSRTDYAHPLFGSLLHWTQPPRAVEDVELEPYGPRVKVQDYSKQQVDPPEESTCTICIEDYGSNVPESSCLRLDVCGHFFHWGCLDTLLNDSAVESVRCPNCRARICDARPRRPR
jgi:hypothetical protein